MVYDFAVPLPIKATVQCYTACSYNLTKWFSYSCVLGQSYPDLTEQGLVTACSLLKDATQTEGADIRPKDETDSLCLPVYFINVRRAIT